MVWHFIGVYIINRTLHDRLEIRNFSSRVEKYFTRSLRSLVKYFSTLEEKFRISARPCNILYMNVCHIQHAGERLNGRKDHFSYLRNLSSWKLYTEPCFHNEAQTATGKWPADMSPLPPASQRRFICN